MAWLLLWQTTGCIVSGKQFPPQHCAAINSNSRRGAPRAKSTRLTVQTDGGEFNALMELSARGGLGAPAIVEWQLAITRPRNHNQTELFAIPQSQFSKHPARRQPAD